MTALSPKKFSPPLNPFAQNVVHPGFVCPPVLFIQGDPSPVFYCARHIMAYHRSYVVLKIPTVHWLKSVKS